MDSQELSVGWFRGNLGAETKRLRALCSDWQSKSEENGRVRCAIGKANILISGRFKQFSGLIDDCELGRGTKKTRVTDLQGFWEMVSFQIEDVDRLFQDLSKPEPGEVKGSVQPQPVKSKRVKCSTAAPPCRKRPAIRDHILAKRRELQGEPAPPSVHVEKADESNGAAQKTDAEKVFDGGFFKVKSPSQQRPLAPKVAVTEVLLPLTPSGYNVQQGRPRSANSKYLLSRHDPTIVPKQTPSKSTTPLAIIKANAAIRRSLSPQVRRAALDFEI